MVLEDLQFYSQVHQILQWSALCPVTIQGTVYTFFKLHLLVKVIQSFITCLFCTDSSPALYYQ